MVANRFSDDFPEHPAPELPPEPARPRGRRPMPVLRQTSTLALPGLDVPPITLQVIVLGEGALGDDDEVMARPEDVPELAEAGWIRHGLYGLDIFVRTVG